MIAPSTDELNERLAKLTEVQRLDFRRRLDSCEAIMALGGATVLDRQSKQIEDADLMEVAGAWWVWVPPIGAALLIGLGHSIEIHVLQTGGYGVLALWLYFLGGGQYASWKVRSRLRELAKLEQLQLDWLAAGASGSLFYEWRKAVELLGHTPTDDDLSNRLRGHLLGRVQPFHLY